MVILNLDDDDDYKNLERLLINNDQLQELQAYLDRFNPIKVMGMESMEIRHSAILAWLLDPVETHGLGDYFLKAFLSQVLRADSTLKCNAVNSRSSERFLHHLEWRFKA